MSDFLSNVVARSLGIAETVRPRLPSLFEPYRRAGGSLALRVESSVTGAVDVEQDHEGTATATGHFEPGRGARPSAPTSLPSRASDSAQAPWRSAHNLRLELVDNNRPPGPLQAESWAGERGPVRDLLPAGAPLDLSSSSHHPTEAPFVLNPLASVVGRKREPDLTQDQTPGAPSEPESGAPNVAVPGHFPPLQSRRVARPTYASPAAIGARGHAPLPTNGSTEPAVHVTIGRVEVRAIFPDPPARRLPMAKPRPTLSLDEYLKQRDRGER